MRSAGILGIGIATLFALPAAAAIAANSAGHQYLNQTNLTALGDSGKPSTQPSEHLSPAKPSDEGSPGATPTPSASEGGDEGGGTPTPPPPTGSGGTENLRFTLPAVVFGPDDGLPKHLTKGQKYTLSVPVWVAIGTESPVATIRYGDDACLKTPLVAGEISTLTCTIRATSGSSTVRVEVSTATRGRSAETNFNHQGS